MSAKVQNHDNFPCRYQSYITTAERQRRTDKLGQNSSAALLWQLSGYRTDEWGRWLTERRNGGKRLRSMRGWLLSNKGFLDQIMDWRRWMLILGLLLIAANCISGIDKLLLLYWGHLLFKLRHGRLKESPVFLNPTVFGFSWEHLNYDCFRHISNVCLTISGSEREFSYWLLILLLINIEINDGVGDCGSIYSQVASTSR